MPVTSITYQPNASQLLAAYRPIRFIVTASTSSGAAVPPFVACDIYISDVYYKTMLRTAPEKINTADSSWAFDIADAIQEYLQPDLAAITNTDVLAARHASAKVHCRFRASNVDNEGFTVEEGVIPVQGDRFNAPQSGTGQQSNTFFVINSTLQHEDNQNLATHLKHYKFGAWNPQAYPLSHRKNYFICPQDSDHYPVIFLGDCVNADLVLRYRLKGSTTLDTAIGNDLNTCDPIGFSVNVLLSKITVTLEDPIPNGHYVFVRYRKQGTTTWTDVGKKTTQEFFFAFSATPYNRGHYDIQVIHYCSPCISSSIVDGTFAYMVDVPDSQTDWRGINPYCIKQTFDPPIYYTLIFRDFAEVESFYPSNQVRQSRNVTVKAKLFALFYSDEYSNYPVSVDLSDFKVYVKSIESITETVSSVVTNRIHERLLSFTVSVSGSEVMLGEVETGINDQNFSTYPTIIAERNSTFAYLPYPTTVLSSGNTGMLAYAALKEYYKSLPLPVMGSQPKPNVPEDPHYIQPVESATCAAGPDVIPVAYEKDLEVAKVEVKYYDQFVYAPTVANTKAGGFEYIIPVPRNTDLSITIKAKTLDAGNTTGFVTVRVVARVQNSWNTITNSYLVKDNIETILKATFKNVARIEISNY